MKFLLIILSIMCFAASGFGQNIKVHVIDDGTKKPLKNIYLNLRIDCENPHRPNALQQKTDSSGTANFPSVSIAGEPVCIDLFSVAYGYAPGQLDYVFASPDAAKRLVDVDKMRNRITTSLPAEITFHVRKRGLGERLDFMFRGP